MKRLATVVVGGREIDGEGRNRNTDVAGLSVPRAKTKWGNSIKQESSQPVSIRGGKETDCSFLSWEMNHPESDVWIQDVDSAGRI